MRAFTVTLSDIRRCPSRRLDAGHYNTDGTCRCVTEPPAVHLPNTWHGPALRGTLCGKEFSDPSWEGTGETVLTDPDEFEDTTCRTCRVLADLDEPEDDGAPCCPDPGCPGRSGHPCTFPGYADNH